MHYVKSAEDVFENEDMQKWWRIFNAMNETNGPSLPKACVEPDS